MIIMIYIYNYIHITHKLSRTTSTTRTSAAASSIKMLILSYKQGHPGPCILCSDPVLKYDVLIFVFVVSDSYNEPLHARGSPSLQLLDRRRVHGRSLRRYCSNAVRVYCFPFPFVFAAKINPPPPNSKGRTRVR